MRKIGLLRAGIIYFFLILVTYSPIIFHGKTLAMSARYPWFENSPPQKEWVSSKVYPNTLNVDFGTPAAYEEPFDLFVGKQIRQGKFPLWNPYLACGTVIQESLSTRTLFPYQLLQDIFPWVWRDLFLLGRLWFAAIGTFIFLRILGVSFQASLCGGILYCLSGAMTAFLTLTQMSNVAMVLPYALLGIELLNRKLNSFSVFFCSLAVSFLILGGQPEVAFYSIFFISSYYFLRTIATKTEQSRQKKFIYFILSILLSLLISSPAFIPFLSGASQYHHLHPAGGTQGITTTTPLLHFRAIILPELLRWREMVSAFPIIDGWDWIGGYLGIGGLFIIFISFRVKWELRKEYLFFLGFGCFILLKNMGMPLIAWIGRLPIFDQVWTPRWAGPVWNLSLVLAVALGFEGILSKNQELNHERNNLLSTEKIMPNTMLFLLGGIFILLLGLLFSPIFYLILKYHLKESKYLLLNLILFRVFYFSLSGFIILKAVKRLKMSLVFPFLLFIITLSVFNFQAQFPSIETSFRDIFSIGGKTFSMWQGMLEATCIGMLTLLALIIGLRLKPISRYYLGNIILGIMIFEMTFHVTLGYGEFGRLVRFSWYLIFLSSFIIYLFYKKDFNRRAVKIILISFCAGLILLPILDKNSLPDRRNVFEYSELESSDFSRSVGVGGVMFPNASSAQGVYDVRSIVSLSIKRFQLFQDYCLSIKPQTKFKSLWFTGFMDPESGVTILDNIRQMRPFYDLAGVNNYFSSEYLDIPQTKLVSDGKFKNYRSLSYNPRAFMVYKWHYADTPKQALKWMLANRNLLGSEAVVEGGVRFSRNQIQEKARAKIQIKKYDLHSVTIDVLTDAPGLLILTDVYHPNWLVTVDGKKEEIFPADLCFRGVFINPGRQVVKFTYFPKIFYRCIIISLLTLGVLLIINFKKIVQSFKII